MVQSKIQVVGYDGSALSELSLRRAIGVTERANVAVVHAVMVASEDGNRVVLPTGERMTQWTALDVLRTTVKELLRTWGFEPRFLKLLAHVRTGDPAAVLVELAYRNHADRILVGARGNRGSLKTVGSVTQRVLELSHIPVLVEAGTALSEPREPFDATRFSMLFGTGIRASGRPGNTAVPVLS